MTPEPTGSRTTQEDVSWQRLLEKEQQRAEFWRALWIALMVILCTLTAILWAVVLL